MLIKIAIGLTLAASSLLVFAQSSTDITAPEEGGAYLQDSRGGIARSGHGLCWRTGYWTPASALPGCDGELVPPIVKPTAPAIVQPPTAAQAPAPAAPPPPPKRCDFAVTLQSDETFGFNRAALTAEARQRLDSDVLARLSQCEKIDLIMVTGHSDRLGSHPYNQKLSEKRAEAVAAYLRNKGAPAHAINILGAGKTLAVQACDDKLPRTQLIACLGPNRRVTVEVSGLAR
jgi:OOP family OmpA-OmpF porin